MTMTFAVWEPGGALEFRDLSWAGLEALVGGRHGAVARTSLWRGGGDRRLLKLLSSDVSLLFPQDYGAHGESASAFVAALGGPVQRWAGVLAVYGIDSVEGGFPESLSAVQREFVTAAYVASVQ